MNDLIIINDTKIPVNIESYEVSKDAYEGNNIVAIFKTTDIVSYIPDQQDFIEDTVAKVRDLLKTTRPVNFDSIYRKETELTLQDSVLKQLRSGNHELAIATEALILYIMNCVSPDVITPTAELPQDTPTVEATPDRPSSKGIVPSSSDEIKLVDAVPEKELSDLRSLKNLNFLDKLDPNIHLMGKEFNISTKYYSGVTKDNLEKAVTELISFEVLKSKKKLLYIIHEPKIKFAQNEPNKFKISEKLVVISEKVKNEQHTQPKV